VAYKILRCLLRGLRQMVEWLMSDRIGFVKVKHSHFEVFSMLILIKYALYGLLMSCTASRLPGPQISITGSAIDLILRILLTIRVLELYILVLNLASFRDVLLTLKKSSCGF
jgi:hypothetical protein